MRTPVVVVLTSVSPLSSPMVGQRFAREKLVCDYEWAAGIISSQLFSPTMLSASWAAWSQFAPAEREEAEAARGEVAPIMRPPPPPPSGPNNVEQSARAT